MQTAFSEKLPCELMPSERASKSDELAREVKRNGELEAQKKLLVARFGKDIKASDQRIAELAEEVRTGIEYREVQCSERVGYPANVVEMIWRHDTGEVFRKRPLSPDEKQADLFDDHPGRTLSTAPDNDNAGPGEDEDDVAQH